MRLYFISFVALFGLAGCGGSSDIPTLAGLPSEGNYISTTVDATYSYLYTLNPADLTVSGFLIPAPEEEAHDHEHEHSALQSVVHDDEHKHEDEHDDEHEHEEEHGDELELIELAGSPFQLGLNSVVGMVVEGHGEYLYLLDQSGLLRIYAISAGDGQLSLLSEVSTPVGSPRLLRLSEDGEALAVLGDQSSLYMVGEDGSLSAPGLIENTESWSDLGLNGDLGAAATEAGAVGFSWTPGLTVEPEAPVELPGSTRSGLAYSSDGVFVVNRQAGSVSQLSQDGEGTLLLLDTLSLSQELHDPILITSLPNGHGVMVANDHSLALLEDIDGSLEEIASTPIEHTPSTLFSLPGSELILVGHAPGQGFTAVEYGEDELHIAAEADPDQLAVSAFGYAQRIVRITETVGF